MQVRISHRPDVAEHSSRGHSSTSALLFIRTPQLRGVHVRSHQIGLEIPQRCHLRRLAYIDGHVRRHCHHKLRLHRQGTCEREIIDMNERPIGG